MIKKIGRANTAHGFQKQQKLKMFGIFSILALFTTVLMAGCQKDGAASTAPPSTISTNLPVMKPDRDAAPVNLRTAGDFTILSETGISTTGVTAITGDIGVSPISSTAITGFGLKKDASNQFSRTPIVTGEVFAANYGVPTPSKMTTAISDMRTAFTSANARTYPAPIVEKYAGDISGKTLPPGLYKWGTGVLITGVGVKLNGLADDVWVFQIAKNLTVSNSAIITLEGGAQAKHVFWVVSGKATLGSGVNFKGIILSKTLISLNTGAKVTGKLLAQTAVTLIADDVHP